MQLFHTLSYQMCSSCFRTDLTSSLKHSRKIHMYIYIYMPMRLSILTIRLFGLESSELARHTCMFGICCSVSWPTVMQNLISQAEYYHEMENILKPIKLQCTNQVSSTLPFFTVFTTFFDNLVIAEQRISQQRKPERL